MTFLAPRLVCKDLHFFAVSMHSEASWKRTTEQNGTVLDNDHHTHEYVPVETP